MNYRKRLLPIIMSIIICVTMLFSYYVIMKHANHHCSKEDCPICMEIEVAVHTISSFKLIISIVSLVMALLCVFTLSCIDSEIYNRTRDTLISLKVELLD